MLLHQMKMSEQNLYHFNPSNWAQIWTDCDFYRLTSSCFEISQLDSGFWWFWKLQMALEGCMMESLLFLNGQNHEIFYRKVVDMKHYRWNLCWFFVIFTVENLDKFHQILLLLTPTSWNHYLADSILHEWQQVHKIIQMWFLFSL